MTPPPSASAAPPPEWVRRMEALLGPEAEPFLAAVADPAPGLRVNTLRLPAARFAAMAPFALGPLAFPPEGFRLLDAGPRPGRHPWHAAGLFYLQDPGAMAVGALVDPRPGERVLDLAAAPGGKATHLAARMGGEGVLVANDVHAGRARELAGNLERCGVRNALVTNESVERLAGHFGPWFHRVLLDAPCSGESMFHKSDAARSDWSPASVLGCARRQKELLSEAARCVAPGGLLVYSTCTFAAEENEGAVGDFLAAHPGWEVEPLPAPPGAAPGRPEWVPGGGDARTRETLRLWPHRVPGAGHYVAALRRPADGAPEPLRDAAGSASGAARALLREWVEASLRGPLPEGEVLARGDELFLLPPGTPELGWLRVERPGLWLGTAARGRFEPAHALALWLPPCRARGIVELDPEGAEVAAYLRGETLASTGEPGWVPVTAGGFALGWGKRVGSTVKNHLPKGLRQR